MLFRSGEITPLFQHRHFAYIASIIKTFPPEIRRKVWRRFSAHLNRTNDRFDADRFHVACGMEHIEQDLAVAEYEEIISIQR